MDHAGAIFLHNGVPDDHMYQLEAAALPNPLNAQLHSLLYKHYPTEALNTIRRIQIETIGTANNQQCRRVFYEFPTTYCTAPVQTPAVLQGPAGRFHESLDGCWLPDASLDLPRQPATCQDATRDLAGAGAGLWGGTQEWESTTGNLGQAASDPHWFEAAPWNGLPQGSNPGALSEGDLPLLPVAGSSGQLNTSAAMPRPSSSTNHSPNLLPPSDWELDQDLFMGMPFLEPQLIDSPSRCSGI